MLEYLLNKLSIERTCYDIAIRSGDLGQQEIRYIRIKLLEELIKYIDNLKIN